MLDRFNFGAEMSGTGILPHLHAGNEKQIPLATSKYWGLKQIESQEGKKQFSSSFSLNMSNVKGCVLPDGFIFNYIMPLNLCGLGSLKADREGERGRVLRSSKAFR